MSRVLLANLAVSWPCSPMSEAGEPSTARRKLDPQLSKLAQLKVGSEDAAAAAGPGTPANQTGKPA
jgi:hypothetical protein